MKKMKVDIRIDGEKKTFSPVFVSARHMRKALELRTDLDFTNLAAEDLDQVVAFICEVYGGQFTIDDVYDGMNNDELDTFIGDTLLTVIYPKLKDTKKSSNNKKK